MMFDGPIDDHCDDEPDYEPEEGLSSEELEAEARLTLDVVRDELTCGPMDAEDITRECEERRQLGFANAFEVALFGAYFRLLVAEEGLDVDITDREQHWTLDVAGLYIVAPNPGQVLEHRDELEAA